MSSQKIKLGVFGAGAFGTSLSILFSNFIDVFLFSGFEDHANEMRKTRKNEFLNEFEIPESVIIDSISNIKLYDFDYILWCFPVAPSVQILSKIQSFINVRTPIIICSKGICDGGMFISEIISNMLPGHNVGILAGPNLAHDIASLKFSAAEVGFNDMRISDKVCDNLSNDLFKLTPNNDVIGLQIAGAIKNIIAIACGICHGLDLGQNAFAALITKGLQEMSELGKVLRANVYTFYGLAGVGDLVLTTSSMMSRNMAFGAKLASGESAEHIKKTSTAVSEGAECIENIIHICNKFKTKSTICRTVYDIINEVKRPENIIDAIRE